MPFINGRYYVNPIMGQALEAAREAEAALAALETRARQDTGSGSNVDTGEGAFSAESNGGSGAPHGNADGPIHRVEIEAAEFVPAHSGRGARGYVARVHRQGTTAASEAQDQPSRFPIAAANGPGRAETHVFADHRDLLTFLRDELAKEPHPRATVSHFE